MKKPKAIVIYYSRTGNTQKIAKVFARTLKCKFLNIKENPKINLDKYNLIFIGSGIYGMKISAEIENFIQKLKNKDMNEKKYVVFGTYGGSKRGIKVMKEILEHKNAKVIGQFGCKGHDDFWLFKIFNVNRGRPDKHDLFEAKEFAQFILKIF
ncbi:flavodoxin domain-containing protein [Candidatus Pacearchaeota archaeon]|nr:flavodoxin domain-containing protein [Candidatus Pacearchaeota archaeon]